MNRRLAIRLFDISLCCCLALIALADTSRAEHFPNTVQACINTGDCSTPTLVVQDSRFSTYTYSVDGVAKVLMKYVLGNESEESIIETGSGERGAQFSGAAWIEGLAQYDLAGSAFHEFVFYRDKIAPEPTDLAFGGAENNDILLALATPELLSGSGELLFPLEFVEPNPDAISIEKLETSGVNVCLAEGCSAGAKFNLLNMQYIDSGTSADFLPDPNDKRTLLYSQFTFFQETGSGTGFDYSQSFVVVPEPTVLSMVIPLLAAMVAVRRKDRV